MSAPHGTRPCCASCPREGGGGGRRRPRPAAVPRPPSRGLPASLPDPETEPTSAVPTPAHPPVGETPVSSYPSGRLRTRSGGEGDLAMKKIVHVVGTGTIGEPLIGLFADFGKHLGFDE